MSSEGQLVVLAGRPNVGKSTLFNRMTGSRRAIVTAVPGTTRDTLVRPVTWQAARFQLQDTGGLYGMSEDPLHDMVAKQGQRALDSADLIVFVVDGREGLVPGDLEIASDLRRRGRPILVAVNKADDKRARGRCPEFAELGFDPIVEISAEHGTGVGDLLDAIVERMGTSSTSEAPLKPALTVAIVGRPNAGKSSLVNRFLKEERVLVSEMPGTTRDPIDVDVTWHRRHFTIVDTAGMRRPGSVRGGGQVELVSVASAKNALIDADIVVLVIDAKAGATDQDASIGGEADKAGRGILIVANKWDLVKSDDPGMVKAFDENLRHQMRFLDYAPILHVSALDGQRVPKVLETIDRIGESRRLRVPTPALNKFLERITAAHPPVSNERRNVRILYASQIGVAPPSFILFTNIATTLHFSYERFLMNQLRKEFGFEGTPIRLQIRRRRKATR